MSVPPSASPLPTHGKFGYPIYHPRDLAAWHAWLAAHHDAQRGCWVAAWRTASGRARVTYVDLVEEALCWGWIDSTTTTYDDDRSLQLMTPRKPKGTWTRLNRQRVADLERQGRMMPAGRRAVEVAQANGWWTILDTVEDLIEPTDLRAALDAAPPARRYWDGFPASAKKQMLLSIVTAVGADTRARRIAKIVDDAALGRRASG